MEIYGNEERVWVTNHKSPWQSVVVKVHRLSEIDTPAFRSFLDEGVAAFFANVKRLHTRPEDVMPWKVNGERWHLSEKGFRAGARLQWDRQLLPRLLELVREVEPRLEVRWDARDAITLRVPGSTRSWAQWRTKDHHGLDCRFLGKKGQFNLSVWEGIGDTSQVSSHRGDADIVRLVFRHAEHLPAARLKKLLTEHLSGFRATFGRPAQ
jgi:excinuclease ABC subunit A